MSEEFNNAIVESKAKPLMTMLEEIRTYLVEKWVTNRMRFPHLSDGDFLPNIKNKVRKPTHSQTSRL